MCKNQGFLTHRVSIRSWPRPSSTGTPEAQKRWKWWQEKRHTCDSWKIKQKKKQRLTCTETLIQSHFNSDIRDVLNLHVHSWHRAAHGVGRRPHTSIILSDKMLKTRLEHSNWKFWFILNYVFVTHFLWETDESAELLIYSPWWVGLALLPF